MLFTIIIPPNSGRGDQNLRAHTFYFFRLLLRVRIIFGQVFGAAVFVGAVILTVTVAFVLVVKGRLLFLGTYYLRVNSDTGNYNERRRDYSVHKKIACAAVVLFAGTFFRRFVGG